ncbi:uncharacterized protein [Drosophila pseudoobscura]|uniref:Uncharacterized protein isoform X3 n=1 Tax=Drosophila pseudoobscura pseudoobscura TaxID=46245 RepID=A0A6I8VWQ8_DROPS|nr:uncharacterized protein LOC117183953 isoform X3 [Drosophila pseudoobscura]
MCSTYTSHSHTSSTRATPNAHRKLRAHGHRASGKSLTLMNGIWRNSYTENKLRGYGVLSGNNLVAIVTLAPRIDKLRDKNETNIFDGYTNRITLLFPYLSWIFEILEEAEIKDIQTGISTNSLPYTERKNAEMVRQNEVSGSFISAAHPCTVTGIVTLILALNFLHFLNQRSLNIS